MGEATISRIFERLDNINERLSRLEGKTGFNEWVIRALIAIIAALTGANLGN